MNRKEIIKDFVNYCMDTKQDTTKKQVKNKYINIYMINFLNCNSIKQFENTRKQIENILKYNPLTIEKIKQEKIGGV